MPKIAQIFLNKKLPLAPFNVESLPLISRLQRVGFHNYKSRWAKRLGKKIGRILFNFAYYNLKLSGQVSVSAIFGGQRKYVYFNSRKLHFSRVFDNQFDNLCEPELATLLDVFLTSDKVFYDIGSNWGYFSMYAAALPNYNGSIHAFEPIEETFFDLYDWIEQTGQKSRVSCHKIALSNSDGTAKMGAVADNSGLASLVRDENTSSIIYEVTTSQLDNLAMPKPDFIKLDVEGYEFEVIQGGLNAIILKKPMIMFENWISKETPEHTMLPINLLLKLGYKLFVPMWWVGAPSNKLFWPRPHEVSPKGQRTMAYVPFDRETRFKLRDQINFFCCHEDRLDEVEKAFDVLSDTQLT
jgi:FkbM family methyltransferase